MVIVLFEVRVKKDKIEDYLQRANMLKKELENYDGFISAERFSSLSNEGKLLSMSVWQDEESVTKWRNNAMHRSSQKFGRQDYFGDYKITVATPNRIYTISDRKNAPIDSNKYFKI